MEFGNPLCKISSVSMCMHNLIKIISTVQEQMPVSFCFSNWTLAKRRPMRKDTWLYLGLEFVSINAYAKFYQNIIIILIRSLFKEDNIFSARTNLTYGPHKT